MELISRKCKNHRQITRYSRGLKAYILSLGCILQYFSIILAIFLQTIAHLSVLPLYPFWPTLDFLSSNLHSRMVQYYTSLSKFPANIAIVF